MTKEEKSTYNKNYYEANKEIIKEREKEWYQSNKERLKEYNKKRHEANREGANKHTVKYNKTKRAADPTFKLACNIRTRHSRVLKGRQSTTKGLGCTKKFLKEYIENQFTEGMNWDNYGHGKDKWTIDHKLPLDLIKTNPELAPQLIHYTNLQPMWFLDNAKKGKKLKL